MHRLNSLMRSEGASTILFLFLGIFLAVSVRMYNIEYFQVLSSDEAIYVQSTFVISRGYVPYRDVFFAHPPFYFLIGSFWMSWVGSSLISARSFNVFLGIGTMVTIYFLCRKLYSTRIAVISSLFYAVLPLAMFYDRLFIVDNALGLLSILTVFTFLIYHKDGSLKHLLLAGFFVGLSLITKLMALQIILFILVVMLSEKRFKHLGWFLLAIFPIPLLTVGLLLASGVLPYFLQQTVYLQFLNMIFAHNLIEKASTLAFYFFWAFPFFSLAAFTMISPKANEDRLITVWYLIPFTLIVLGRNVFLQYFVSLNAPLAILAALTASRLKIPLSPRQLAKMHPRFNILNKILLIFMLLIFVSASLQYSTVMILGTYENRVSQEAKIQTANYIKSITRPEEKIWTTDASIAFLAQRIIVAPDSKYYKYQGFFTGTFGYSEDGTYKGPFNSGLFTLLHLNEILNAWQTNKPKVIVVVRSSFLDSLVLNGINNSYYSETGLDQYLITHYHLARTFNPERIEVWVETT